MNQVLQKIFPTYNSKDALWLSVILGCYIVVGFIGLSFHEMWRDELEPWLVGSSSKTLADFFHNMKQGSNPYIWYLILHFISKLSLNPVIDQIVHFSFSIGAVFLFLRYSPFSLWKKFFFCFGYYILFEYGIISRGYALTVFFLFLFCTLFKTQWKNSIWLGVALFFLANATGGFGVIFSASLLLFLVSNYYFNEMADGKKKYKAKNIGWLIGIVIVSIWLAMKAITPPPNSPYAITWFTGFGWERFFLVFWRIWSGYLPIPRLDTVQFWNTNLVNLWGVHIDNQVPYSFPLQILLTVGSIFIVVYSILLFSRSISVLLFFLSASSGIILFCYMNPSIFVINATRYHGFLYLIFFVALWLMQYFPTHNTKEIYLLTSLRRKLKIGNYAKYVVWFLLIVNFTGGMIAYGKDAKYVFSNVEIAGKYVVQNNLTRFPAAGYVDYTVSPISAFTLKPFYYPDRDVTSTFPVWTLDNYSYDPNVIINRLLNFIHKQPDTTLIIVNFPLNTYAIGDITFKHLMTCEESIVADERYSIYLASKFNLEHALNKPFSEMTNEDIEFLINLGKNFLQQNQIDVCNRILQKIRPRMEENALPGYNNLKGLWDIKNNRVNDAKHDFLREVTLGFQKEDAYLQLGILYYNEQKADSAIYSWDNVLTINPNNMDAYGNLGVCYLNLKKDAARAENYWRTAVKTNENYTQGYIFLMFLCQNRNDESCLIQNLRILLSKGVSVNDIKNKGINITDEMIKKAS